MHQALGGNEQDMKCEIVLKLPISDREEQQVLELAQGDGDLPYQQQTVASCSTLLMADDANPALS